MTRRNWQAAALAAVAIGLGLWGVLRDPVSTGDAVPVSWSAQGRSLLFQVPTGSVRVVVGAATRHPEVVRDAEVPVLGLGDRWLPVSYPLDPDVRISVVADGERSELPNANALRAAGEVVEESREGSSEERLVAVAEGRDVSVEVTFDGLTQTGDLASGDIDAGLAAPLYEQKRQLLVSSCETRLEQYPAWRPSEYDVACPSWAALAVDVYRPELGWVAAPEERFVSSVDWSLGPQSIYVRDDIWLQRDWSGAATLNGREPDLASVGQTPNAGRSLTWRVRMSESTPPLRLTTTAQYLPVVNSYLPASERGVASRLIGTATLWEGYVP